MTGIRMTEQEPFWESVRERTPSRIPQMFARVADGVSDTGSREFVHRLGNLICAGKNIPYIRIYIIRLALSLSPILSNPSALLGRRLAYVPSAYVSDISRLSGFSISVYVSRQCYSTSLKYYYLAFHALGSLEPVLSCLVRPLFSREISSSLGARTKRGINLAARGGREYLCTLEKQRGAASERWVLTYLLNRCM